MIPTKPSGQRYLPRPIISLFNCDPVDIQRDNLLDLFKKHKIAVKRAVFNSPAYTQAKTYEVQQAIHTALVAPDLRWIRDNDLSLIAGGDEMGREQPERTAADTIDWFPKAITTLANRLQVMGNCLYLATIDEHDLKIGGWDGFDRIAEAWRAGMGPPISHPTLCPPSRLDHPATADLHNRQMCWWACRTLREYIAQIKRAFIGVRKGWLVSCNICTMGPKFIVDREGRVLPSHLGVKPEWIPAQGWAAFAMGGSYLECYSYNCHRWRVAFNEKLPNTTLWQGMSEGPGRPGELWGGFGKLLASIKNHEHGLMMTPYEPVFKGPYMVGRRGKFVWAINRSRSVVTHPFNLRKRMEPAEVVFKYL